MSKIFRCLPSLFFSLIWLAAAAQKGDNPNTLKLKIRNISTDTARVTSILNLGSYYLEKGLDDLRFQDSAFLYFNQALALSVRLRDDDRTNRCTIYLGHLYLQERNLSKAKTCFIKVIDYYKKHNDGKKEAHLWDEFGFYIDNDDSDFKSLEFGANAIAGVKFKSGFLINLNS